MACFKSLAGCDPLQQEHPQEGQIHLDTAAQLLKFRAHFLPALQGEALTLALLLPGEVISLARLQLEDPVERVFPWVVPVPVDSTVPARSWPAGCAVCCRRIPTSS